MSSDLRSPKRNTSELYNDEMEVYKHLDLPHERECFPRANRDYTKPWHPSGAPEVV